MAIKRVDDVRVARRERNEWIVIALVCVLISIGCIVVFYQNQRRVEVAVESGVLRHGNELYTLIPSKFEPGLKVEYITNDRGEIIGRRLVSRKNPESRSQNPE